MTTEARSTPAARETSPPDSRMEEFMAMAEYQANVELPQNGDEFTKAFQEAFACQLKGNEKFREYYEWLFKLNSDVTADNLYRQNLKTFQFIEGNRDPDFPRNHSEHERWDLAFDTLLNDPDYDTLFMGSVFTPLRSNISERGSPLKVEILLHGKERPRILDTGSSLNNILKRMVLEDDPDLHYKEIQIMRRVKGENPQLDQEVTQKFNRWLSPAAVTLGPSMGIDIINYEKDETARERAYSDSRYMGELLDKGLERQLSILESLKKVTNIGFKNLDAANFDPAELGEKFDVTFLSTMLYESPPDDVKRILANARAATREDGIIVVQDFIRSAPKSGELQFYKRWPAYTYGVWVEDMQRPDLGLRKHFSVLGGRIEKMIPEKALADLPLARKLGLVARRSVK